MPKYLSAVIKPAVDTRSYRALQLDNGLTALLISDPETDISAAALSVHAGTFSSPPDILGLAHFNEHMLSLGSKKYPVESEYWKFISQNGGRKNAYTTAVYTRYHFDVSPDKLEPALDRFAQFFIDPLFLPDVVNREMEAVHSEHQKNKEQDHRRLRAIKRVLADQTHDFAKFGCGNLETLRDIPASKGLDIREELIKFNEQHYSANIMYLAVCGKESLDELESIVTPKFSPIVNRELKCKTYENPYKKEHLMKQVSVVPIKDKRTMIFYFNFPDDTKLYKCSPGRYISHLIGYEGKGSLFSELKALGLISSFSAKNESTDGIGQFDITVELTEDGLKRTDEVAKNVFQYINLLKHKGPQEYIFQEMKGLGFIKFNVLEKSQPVEAVKKFAKYMHYYPVEDLISADYLLDCYQPEVITQHLEHLTPENCFILLISKSFEGQTDQTEHFYGAEYKVEPFSESLLASITNVRLNDAYSLPKPNTLIPTEFKLVSDKKDEDKSKFPVRIMKNSIRQVWYLQDWTYLEPKIYFKLCLVNPINLCSAHALNCQSLTPMLFNDASAEYLHRARLAGLDFSIEPNDVGYTLTFFGYDHKMAHFVEQILQRLVNHKIDPKRFAIQKERYQRILMNYKTTLLFDLTDYYDSLLKNEYGFTKEECIDALDQLTLEAVQQFWVHFTAQLDCDILVYGNIKQADAKGLVKIFDEQFLAKYNTKPLPQDAPRRVRQVQLPPSSSHLFETVNEIQAMKAISCFYQVGNKDSERSSLYIIAQILEEPFFTHLRTEEQLGYLVSSCYSQSCGVHGMSFKIQSQFGTEYLERRIEAFLANAKKIIAKMSDENFEKAKTNAITKLLKKKETLYGFGGALWSRIECRDYDFEYEKNLADDIKLLKRIDVLQLFNHTFCCDSPGRRKITVRINRVNPEENLFEPTEEAKEGILPEVTFVENPVLITDYKAFKDGCTFFPVPKPKDWN